MPYESKDNTDADLAGVAINCLQLPIDKMLEHGFSTGHGALRTPSTIGSAATLCCIAIQSNQNDMFGGQSIPYLDYALAPFVAKSFVRNCALYLETINVQNYIDCSMITGNEFSPQMLKKEFVSPLDDYIKENKRIMHENGLKMVTGMTGAILHSMHDMSSHMHICDPVKTYALVEKMIPWATRKTEHDTFQAMEALVHNLCTLNSRSGGQVPFSSVNTGTDTSAEGRLITKSLFLAQEDGLGNGETAIFPISIMKMKKGITDKGSPNHDLFELACRVSAKRLFPNFLNLDAPYNLQYYQEGRPETEVATMGCRTRVIGNTFDPDNQITPGRGNIFPITINLPFIALEAKENVHKRTEVNDILSDPTVFTDIESMSVYKEFMKLLDIQMDHVFQMIHDRFEAISKRKAKNFPFLMGQRLYVGSEYLGPEDEIREVIKHGTLVTGFIGLAETLIVLFEKHHGESEFCQEKGLEIVAHMNQRCIDKAKELRLNYSFMATPAEGCCGRLLRLTRARFGTIRGVTDHEYLTNSFHKLNVA